MSYVSKPIRKRDAMSLVTGKPVYTGDLCPAGALQVCLCLLYTSEVPPPSVSGPPSISKPEQEHSWPP